MLHDKNKSELIPTTPDAVRVTEEIGSDLSKQEVVQLPPGNYAATNPGSENLDSSKENPYDCPYFRTRLSCSASISRD